MGKVVRWVYEHNVPVEKYARQIPVEIVRKIGEGRYIGRHYKNGERVEIELKARNSR